MLLAVLIDTEALKVDIPSRTELRLDWTRNIDWALDAQMLDAALHHRELDRDLARHLNRSAEGNLAISLREVQVPDGELGTSNMDRQVHFAATREVLDITIAAVFWSAGDGASSLTADLLFDAVVSSSHVYVRGIGWLSDVTAHVRALADECGFTVIPCLQHFMGGCTTQDTGMDETCETHAGDVARGAIDALEVPDGLRSAMAISKSRL